MARLRPMHRVLPLLLLACTPPDELITSDVTALRVEPASVSLEVGEDSPAGQQFTAWATFDSGEEGPIDLVAWEVSNNSAGTIDEEGWFEAARTNGGATLVTASHLGIEATAEVTVTYVSRTVEEGLDPALAEAFDAATPTSAEHPALLYPAADVGVPRNLEGLTFLWDLPEGAGVCELRFRSELTDLAVVTASDRWTASSTLWTRITATNREAEVEVGVTCGAWDGASLSGVVAGPEQRLYANRFDAQGSVLYWETNTESVARLPVGATERSTYWTAADSNANCVGCHVLSEASGLMSVTHDGIQGTFSVVDVSEPDAPTLLLSGEDARRATFKTFSPDGLSLLGTRGGLASLWDAVSGALIRDFSTDGYVDQPDWAPDGADVVMVRVRGTVYSDLSFYEGEIALYPWDGQELGAPTVIVPWEAGVNSYAPAFSPDGRWIAFSRSTGDANSDPDAEVWLVSRDGSQLMRLDAANGEGQLGNSMPRWAPLPDDDVLWLAFSSRRSYPPRPPEDGTRDQRPQIWIAAIDPTRATAGEDPSRAAFWLPGQDLRSDNHLPIWWRE
ncbi:MAG: hypothetical protein ABIO70_22085 [Pseudomonadota bacterium]